MKIQESIYLIACGWCTGSNYMKDRTPPRGFFARTVTLQKSCWWCLNMIQIYDWFLNLKGSKHWKICQPVFFMWDKTALETQRQVIGIMPKNWGFREEEGVLSHGNWAFLNVSLVKLEGFSRGGDVKNYQLGISSK